MPVLLILILASLGIATAFLCGFIWAVNTGQFDDTCTPSMRILTEEEGRKQSLGGSRATGPLPLSLEQVELTDDFRHTSDSMTTPKTNPL
jgi:cbb3-type cytochrome oxidase maturation protein